MRPLIALSIALVGCADAPTVPSEGDLASTLRAFSPPAEVHGCSDIFVYAATPNDTKVLEIMVSDGLALEAARDDIVIERTYTLPDPAVSVVAKWGTDLTLNHCDDVWFGNPTVVGEAEAWAGTVTVVIEPIGVYQPWDHTGYATITLDQVTFDNPQTGAPLEIEMTLADVVVGWYPG